MDTILNYFSWWYLIPLLLLIIALKDIFFNRKHTIKHNFPVVGHLRYFLEKIGPELRQYIVANNREELPFTRSERSWVYASSKKENNYQGFGTDQDLSRPGHVFIKPSLFPFKVTDKNHPNFKDLNLVPCAKIMGAYNNRRRPYRPYSIVNISGMSFGSLSAKAIESLNKGAAKAGAYQNTGEGGLSPYHKYGADVMFHFGTGYFGVRDEHGNFSMQKLKEIVDQNPNIRAIDIKISQGAKPGKGGVLPAAKITKEISDIRGIPMGKDAISPASHSAFSDIPSFLDFIEDIAQETGLPVGFKAAVGKMEMWEELANEMLKRNTGPDFITIDGGEGGTGAAPPAFSESVSLPWVYGFANVYKIFKDKGLADRIVFCASGKLGFPAKAVMAFAMGADVIHVAREAMMSIGCIQAQVCHTNRCPAGVATQNNWLQNGIDVTHKAVRAYNYLTTLRKEILEITHACGYEHPCQIQMSDIDLSMGDNNFTKSLDECFGYTKVPIQFSSTSELVQCKYLGAVKNINI
ncbi:MAG: FMN-binding glutamate synthase family protein [Cytophagales bacterium]